MGTVIINGKRYDAQTGLALDTDNVSKLAKKTAVQDIEIEVSQHKVAKPSTRENALPTNSQKPKRVSKQQRLAEAVAEEFANDNTNNRRRRSDSKILTPKQPLNKDSKIATPNWIKNYNAGNAPLEIQPVVITPKKSKSAIRHKIADNNSRSVKDSATLNRRFVKKPLASHQKTQQINVTRRQSKQIATHPSVHHFAPVNFAQPEKSKVEKPAAAITVSKKSAVTDAPFRPAINHKAEKIVVAHNSKQINHTPKQVARTDNHLSGSMLKNALIQEQLDRPIVKDSKVQKVIKTKRHFRASSLITAAFAIMLIGGYLTYINMPSISVRVAAANAGIAGRSPYTPDGYSIDGSVAYAPGSITINYKSNGDGKGYSVIEQKTDIATDETLSGMVKKNTSDYRKVTTDSGDLYLYGNNALWFSGGIIYTLNGNETLSEHQITQIANSVSS